MIIKKTERVHDPDQGRGVAYLVIDTEYPWSATRPNTFSTWLATKNEVGEVVVWSEIVFFDQYDPRRRAGGHAFVEASKEQERVARIAEYEAVKRAERERAEPGDPRDAG